MLSRPWVVGPISELTRAIHVQGQFAGATVTIVSIGPNARVLAKDKAASSDTRLALTPGEVLHHDDLLVAMQELGLDASPQPAAGMPLAVPVERGPSVPSDLGYVSFVSNLWECGRYVWLKGGVPGAECTVSMGGATIGSDTFFESEGARLALSQPLEKTTVSAQQLVPMLA